MAEEGLEFAVIPTAIGECALVWNAAGEIVGSTLPHGGADEVRRAVRSWCPGAVEAPPAPVEAAAAALARLLAEGVGTLADVPVDMSAVPDFDRRVYEVVRAIPPGETRTYGEVAAALGAPGAAQAVGQAMGRNPFPPIVPCHRVLAAGRRVGGFSARGGPRTKVRMLETEGVYLEQPTLFDL
ncbi:methylated-DNA--[protein]-cysteine S-methyltransferase [Promicromonospora thailandica]|uniref:Methylated-DNA-[protein]-cysteine S-methyltransferase n=1 Tax=Promicromonospora thailandica TaxID=765201 RepID=A0A9X2G576_9MICO|nr:MGMT family protein [Promicromonospora thailandica]MCP2263499.1 methylated-DNA-[protein]-cysteine S-methyltransferase [Promicromonospora thailandica]